MNKEDNQKYLLVPKAKTFTQTKGEWQTGLPVPVVLMEELMELSVPLKESWSREFQVLDREPLEEKGKVRFQIKKNLGKEAYELEILSTGAVIGCSGPQGAFCGLMTLRQLLMQERVPCCRIQDEAGLKLRGYMLDIGRGKVPTLETLKETADLLASLKYNHLELYIEGMPFAYPSMKEYWKDKTPLTPEEIRELDDYCSRRFIELTPNQNSLGHMAPWLAYPNLRPLAEKEEGLMIQGIKTPPTTLDCENPGSLAFVEGLMDDLLPCFRSELFNVGMDEPFELGKGKNSQAAKARGEAELYLDYVKKLHQAVLKRGKTMLMWDDIAVKHPEMISQLPEDIILLEWGYEAAHPFEKRCAFLEEAGRKFLVCPGTSSWNSISGVTDNMIANIRKAGAAAYAHHAEGMLLTDWGDGGHLQYLPISWGGILLAAAWSWNGQDLTEEELREALDCFLFEDAAGELGSVLLDLGRYYQMEEFPLGCGTLTMFPLLLPPIRGREGWDRIRSAVSNITVQMASPETAEAFLDWQKEKKELDLEGIDCWEERLAERIRRSEPGCPKKELVKAELQNALELVTALVHARAVLEADEEDPYWSNRLKNAVKRHRELWFMRNKAWDVELGAGKLENIAKEIGRRTK